MSSMSIVADGEFAGWRTWPEDVFETRSGPYFARDEADGSVVCAFRAEPKHMNGGGFMHGGCLMTFADFALFAFVSKEIEGAPSVTVSMSSDFLGRVMTGQLVEARGGPTRIGGRLIFIRGLITADGAAALSFSGIVSKVKARVG